MTKFDGVEFQVRDWFRRLEAESMFGPPFKRADSRASGSGRRPALVRHRFARRRERVLIGVTELPNSCGAAVRLLGRTSKTVKAALNTATSGFTRGDWE